MTIAGNSIEEHCDCYTAVDRLIKNRDFCLKYNIMVFVLECVQQCGVCPECIMQRQCCVRAAVYKAIMVSCMFGTYATM